MFCFTLFRIWQVTLILMMQSYTLDSPQMTEKNADSENELLVASSHSHPIMSPLEERLMTTAFHKSVFGKNFTPKRITALQLRAKIFYYYRYSLAVSCQRDVVDARLAILNGGGQSFLSRQRQPPTRKSSLNKRAK